MGYLTEDDYFLPDAHINRLLAIISDLKDNLAVAKSALDAIANYHTKDHVWVGEDIHEGFIHEAKVALAKLKDEKK